MVEAPPPVVTALVVSALVAVVTAPLVVLVVAPPLVEEAWVLLATVSPVLVLALPVVGVPPLALPVGVPSLLESSLQLHERHRAANTGRYRESSMKDFLKSERGLEPPCDGANSTNRVSYLRSLTEAASTSRSRISNVPRPFADTLSVQAFSRRVRKGFDSSSTV